MKIITDKSKIDEVLTRGVENIYPNREALEKVLLSGKKLRIYTALTRPVNCISGMAWF